jgi:hypothetical protein
VAIEVLTKKRIVPNFREIILCMLFAIPWTCQAEVLEVTSGGFSVSSMASSSATPANAWKTMTHHIHEWWHPDHSWSGDAKNLYMEAELGGCFCENLPLDTQGGGGGVEHLRIIYINPNREIRFDGSLGPLQTMSVQGRMIWKIEAVENGSEITFTYRVHGSSEKGFEGIAPAVDSVIKQQLDRLARRAGLPL